MNQFQPLTLADRGLIESYLREYPPEVSDLSFTNLYLWHFSRTIRFCEIAGTLCIETTYPEQLPFVFFPIGGGDKLQAIENLIAHYQSQNIPFCIHSLSEKDKAELEALMPERFVFEHNRDRSDYIYETNSLIELRGRKFHKKKNHVNQFYENYPDYRYETLTESNQGELLATWNTWFASLSPTQSLSNEHIGICNAITHFADLSFTCGIVRVGSEIVAFSLGEALNKETAVIHIEKANIRYHGAYQVINQLFLKHEWSGYRFVNREEDLGIEGLRKAKLSYQPYCILDKYEARLMKEG